MEYTDDEQVEKLKAWWKTYGTALVVGVAIGLGILYGGRYWNQLQLEKAAQASMLFDQLIFHVQSKNDNNIKITGSKIVEEFGRTPYAGLTALILARISFDSNDKDRAKQELAWAMDNAREEGVRQVARIRLGRMLLAENKLEDASNLLTAGPGVGFEFEHYELVADILKKKGDLTGARSAYQKALSKANGVDKYKSIIQMKMDDLG